MYKIFKALFSILLISAFSADFTHASTQDENAFFQNNPKAKYRIPGYETYLVTSYDIDARGFIQTGMDIMLEGDVKIGAILLQYYPDARAQFYSSSPAGTLRLRSIKIKADYRQQGHAGRALETLFISARKHGADSFKEIWLEVNFRPEYLIPFYEKLGFLSGRTTGWGDVIEMSVKAKKTKFPYHNAFKTAQVESAG